MPTPAHKVRKPDSHNTPRLDRLTDAQRNTLIGWLVVEKISYDSARRRVLQKFGLKVSHGSLNKFWQHHCGQVLIQAEAAKKGLEICVTVKLGGIPIATGTVIASLPESLKKGFV